ncbi:MAG: ATP-binding protein, partial [Ferruginibacter sp.]
QEQKTFTQELEEKVFSRTAALKASEEKFYNLFNLSPICKTLTDAQTGKIVMVNDAFTHIFGYSREESYDKTTAELGMLDPKRRESVIHELKTNGKIKNIEIEFTKQSGEKFFALTSGEVISIEGKQYYLGAYNDISDRKKAEKNLEHKNIELEKLNKELQSFAYISSHDLQEPLRKIQTFATRILEKEETSLSDYGKDMFNRMQDAAQRMQTLIQDLLAYSRTTTNDRKFESTDLNKIIAEVKEDFKEELEEKHATIETNQLCDADIIPFQFRQLMHNLIGNSLKFYNPQRPPLIQISSEISKGVKFNNEKLKPQNKYCHITVTDNGIGFEQQYNEKIFEVFQRLHGKNEYKGTGIGLSIVKKIVENHYGIITANSELNKGTTFEIYIPAT